MAEPFLSEIRIMSFGYAPRGWAMCNGQLLPINQNQALFSLLGTTFGGNGQTTVGDKAFAINNILAAAGNLYAGPANLVAINPTTITNVGGSQAHLNMQPF